MVKTFPRYELLKREEVMVDHQPAIQLEFIWRTPDNIFVHQQQTILHCSQVLLGNTMFEKLCFVFHPKLHFFIRQSEAFLETGQSGYRPP